MFKYISLILSFTFILIRTAAADTYDLEQFLSLVRDNSKQLQLAVKDKELAKVNKRQAISTALPKVALQADYTRNLTDFYMYADLGELFGEGDDGAVKFKVNRNNEYSANIALQQTLFSPSVGNAIKAARQYQKLTDLAYEANEQGVISAAKMMFYQTLLLEKFWDISRSAEENAKENYDNMSLKFDNGVISEFELLQAEVRWKNAIPETAKARRNYEMALNNLKNLAGIPVDTAIDLAGNFDSYPKLPEKRMPFDSILRQRPDFNALLWEEKLRSTNLSAKKSAFLPTLTGSFVYAYSAQSDYWKLEQDNGLFMAGVNLSIPIFTGGYLSSEVQRARIELNKTQVSIDTNREQIYNEVSNIYLQLKEAHQRIASAEATLNAAKKAFQIAETTAQNGLATQLQLKDARVGFDQATMNYYAAIFDYLNATFQWERVTGRVD